jgi:hypothetical protein
VEKLKISERKVRKKRGNFQSKREKKKKRERKE